MPIEFFRAVASYGPFLQRTEGPLWLDHVCGNIRAMEFHAGENMLVPPYPSLATPF